MGVRVRVGDFSTQAAATTVASTLTGDGFAPLVEWTGFDPTPDPDAELLHVAIVDPHRFAGRAIAYHGSAIASRQTVPAASRDARLARRHQRGVLHDRCAAGRRHRRQHRRVRVRRPDRVARQRRPRRARVRRAAAGTDREPDDVGAPALGRQLDRGAWHQPARQRRGLRSRGLRSDLGAPPEHAVHGPERPRPVHADVRRATARAPASGPALQAVLSPHGRVESVGAPGGTLPAGDSAVQAIGSDAAWLGAHAKVGRTLTVSERLRTDRGAPVALGPETSIASAGPVLLRGGRVDIDAVDEGVLDPRDLNDYTFSAYRHARTFAGVDRSGRLLLATADGIPGVSEGLTLTEEAEVMRSLGAIVAMNLDGGGSTQFASDGQLINDASGTPLRPVGDTIQIVPTN